MTVVNSGLKLERVLQVYDSKNCDSLLSLSKERKISLKDALRFTDDLS